MWFADTPWPPIFIGLALIAILVVAWNVTRRGAYLMWALGLSVACVAVYFAEQQIVTEAERVEAAIHGVTTAFEQGDLDKTLSYIAPSETLMRTAVSLAITRYDVKDDLRITDVQVEMRANETLAVSKFRANATIESKADNYRAQHPSYWEVTWQKIEGDWKITDFQRLHVVSGKPIDTFSGQ